MGCRRASASPTFGDKNNETSLHRFADRRGHASGSGRGAARAVHSPVDRRHDVNATGEVTRVPDVAIISAGVVTRSTTASGAIQDAANRMERVRAALKRAGIDDRDIQTSNISLNPEYRYENNQPPQLVGYSASNQLSVRFRDIRNSGRILDALVSVTCLCRGGMFTAADEAGRARADLYARSLGMRVVRVVSVSESGGYAVPPPMPMVMQARAEGAADTKIDPGVQKLQVNLAMVFELQ